MLALEENVPWEKVLKGQSQEKYLAIKQTENERYTRNAEAWNWSVEIGSRSYQKPTKLEQSNQLW